MSTRHHCLTDPLIALGVGLAAFALYLRTLAPGLLWGDSAEFQFAAWLGGFAHPTGYPLYLMLGWLWTHLLPLGDPAWRMNLFSALWGGAAVGLVYLVAARILWAVEPTPPAPLPFDRLRADSAREEATSPSPAQKGGAASPSPAQKGGAASPSPAQKGGATSPSPAQKGGATSPSPRRRGGWGVRSVPLAAALVFAATPTLWSQAVVAEVYTLHAAFVAAILLAALAWADPTGRRSLLRAVASPGVRPQAPADPAGRRSLLRLYLLAGLVGLGLAHHRTTLLLLPGLAVFLWLDWRLGTAEHPFDELRAGSERRAAAHSRRMRSGPCVSPHPSTAPGALPRLRSGCLLTAEKDGLMARHLLTAVALLLAPLLLYAYIPLIAPRAPYAAVTLGPGQTLALYAPTLAGFLAHISGSVFGSALGAARGPWLAELAGRLAGELTWPGVALGLAGIARLAWRDRRTLALTGLSFLAFVLFNAFYAIGDIFVFYIPVYLIWVLWVCVGAGAVGQGLSGGAKLLLRRHAERVGGATFKADVHVAGENAVNGQRSAVGAFNVVEVLLIAGLLALAGWLLAANFARVDRSADRAARAAWEAVLAQPIPQDAILITNDRDEMVPQWYLRYVEGRRADLTGLFPLIQPGPGWSDVAAVTEQALRTGRPVYLIKPMPGLEVKFALEPVAGQAAEGIGALVRVAGPAAGGQLAQASGAAFGDQMRLAGYEARPATVGPGRTLEVALDWAPLGPVVHDYTTFVHLVNAEGRVIGQSDHRPGGVYYPTGLWRAGERLRDVHRFVIANDLGPAPYILEVGLYRLAPDLQHLGSPQRVGELEPRG